MPANDEIRELSVEKLIDPPIDAAWKAWTDQLEAVAERIAETIDA